VGNAIQEVRFDLSISLYPPTFYIRPFYN